MSSTLAALGTKAGKEPEHRFRSLARLLDRQMLGEAFRTLKRKAAPSIDGVTHGAYAENLDENLLALESRLKEKLERWSPSDKGTPQGGIISPLLGNIYLHFVQDLWISKVVARESKGSVLFRRYADDSIVCFERKDDAEAYLRELPKRLEKFGLELAGEKSALVKFNRWEPESSGKFTFLGFDFHRGTSHR